MSGPHLRRWAQLSILAAVVTLLLKAAAWYITGSVGLLSDAAESFVNLAAAAAAYFSLVYAARPVDQDHTYGHEKIEFFSSGLEGGLILVAAVAIAVLAIQRLVAPQPLEPLGRGLAFVVVATAINAAVGLLLLRLGRAQRSIVLEADGQHLMSDVWTSVGVLAGVGLVWLTGILAMDSVVALAVAASLLWTASRLVRRSFDGLMDRALPEDDLAKLRAAIQPQLGPDMDFHALRTRQAGARRFVDFHLLVPGSMSVRDAHALGDRIEDAVREALAGVEVTVHVEPVEEPASYRDSALMPIEEAARKEREKQGRAPAP
jgi:cation diffusion facilitator family transporter